MDTKELLLDIDRMSNAIADMAKDIESKLDRRDSVLRAIVPRSFDKSDAEGGQEDEQMEYRAWMEDMGVSDGK